MIRKTLEEICIDKGATGGNLYKKIQDLSNKILIPKDLIEAMHELRLLGNDAAHIEAETYNNIGSEELIISIDFTQEIIKAIYQYENLLGKLRSLKKPADSAPANPWKALSFARRIERTKVYLPQHMVARQQVNC